MNKICGCAYLIDVYIFKDIWDSKIYHSDHEVVEELISPPFSS